MQGLHEHVYMSWLGIIVKKAKNSSNGAYCTNIYFLSDSLYLVKVLDILGRIQNILADVWASLYESVP